MQSLELFPVSWLLEPLKKKSHIKSVNVNPLVELDAPSAIKRATEYLRGPAPKAIAFEGGNDTTYKVAARVRDFGISEGLALDLVGEHWNEAGKADPPWDAAELQTIIGNAYAYATAGWGCMSGLAEGFEPAEILEKAKPSLILSSADFLAGFIPPDYLIDGLIQRRFIYSVTAHTGTGKTAILLLIAALVALGKNLAEREIEKGRVLYLAGENPDDVRMRWIAMSERIDFDTSEIDVHFIPGTFSIPQMEKRIREETDKLGGVALVIIDTSAAYFQGHEENSNVELGNHAREMRRLTTLAGGPTVLVACHPVKNAPNDNLLPRGGYAFLAEVDGNLVCIKREALVDLHWHGKFRGPDFAPVGFQLITAQSDKLRDSRRRPIPTVVAKVLNDKARAEIGSDITRAEDQMLLKLDEGPQKSIAAIARALDWAGKGGKPKAQRALEKLRKEKLVIKIRDRWEITKKGREEAPRVRAETLAQFIESEGEDKCTKRLVDPYVPCGKAEMYADNPTTAQECSVAQDG